MNLLSTALLSGGSIIDFDNTFFVQLGIFFLAFLVLRSLVFKPMVALFEAREERMEGARVEAKETQKDAAEKAKAFDEEMRKVRLWAGDRRDALRQEGKQLEVRVLDQVRTETQSRLAEANTRLAEEGVRMRAEIEASVPALAKQIASKLLSREVH